MNLDPRLSLCAQAVQGDYVCDIGTDHGCLPAFLLLSGKCGRALCADINIKPLKSAEETLKKAGVFHMAKTRLSDGFAALDITGVTDIVIAGMGGETIAKILSHEKARCSANFILQPMSRAEILRDFLGANGFEVTSENAAVSGEFAYTVMTCRFTEVPYAVSAERCITGLLDSSDPAAREYVSKQLKRMTAAAKGLINSSDISQKSKGEKLLLLAENIQPEWNL
ncbi:MAG: class I SAM-dependent methyltransferase [Ruminococcus sp.]|nr:class I SAM-dependent methyltransferase [Ruminococcus sp.]